MVDSMSLSLKCVQTLEGHGDKIWSLAWNPQGDLLASCSSDKTIKIWGRGSDGFLECQATLENQHKKTIRAICWSPDGSRLVSAGFDSQICIWLKGEDSFECVANMEGHENEIKALTIDSKGEYMASCGRDKNIWIWEKDEGEELGCSSILSGHSQDVKKVAWVPNSLVLASCSYDNTIKFWTPGDDDWNCIDTIAGHSSTVWNIDFTKDGMFMASVSDDMKTKIWVKNEEFEEKDFYNHIGTLEGYHDRPIYSCSWNYDGTFLVTAGGDDQICLFSKSEPYSGDPAPSFSLIDKKEDAHTQDINCAIFHPTMNIIATCSDDRTIKIWFVNADTAYSNESQMQQE